MDYADIAALMWHDYNSETRNLQLQSEMDALELAYFMHKHQYIDPALGLSKKIDHINALAPRLPQGFGDNDH